MSVIDDLLALQAQDEQLGKLKKEISDIPERIKQEEETLRNYELGIQAATDQIASSEAKCRSLEKDAEKIRESITYYEATRQTLRTAQEFTSMGRQIDGLRRELAEKESRLARANELIYNAHQDINRLQVLCEEEKNRIDSTLTALRHRLVAAQDEYMACEQVRKEKAAVLDVPEKRKFLSYYDRLRKKFFPVIVRIKDADRQGDPCVCPGCHMTLTSSKIQEAHRNAMLADDPAKMKTVACDYCGRLLFK